MTKVVKAGHSSNAVVTVSFETPIGYSPEAWHRESVLQEVLGQGKGAVYDVTVATDLDPEPYPHATAEIQLSCAPEKEDALLKALTVELQAIAARTKDIETQEKTNAY